jgi:hypothetical protein
VFSASVPKLAAYFNADEASIRKAIALLVSKGFFEVLGQIPGTTRHYRAIGHTEWGAKNPGKCTEKETMPWSNEPGDTLGVELYAISGRLFPVYPNLLKGMRNTGHNDAAIREHFRTFFREQTGDQCKNWKHGFAGRFIKYLKAKLP